MKIIRCSYDKVPDGAEIKDSVPSYLQRVAQAVRNEQDAITEYDYILQSPYTPQDIKDRVEEIQNDEKDHMVILSDLLKKYAIKDFPNNTEELNSFDISSSKVSDGRYIKGDSDMEKEYDESLPVELWDIADRIQSVLDDYISDDILFSEGDKATLSDAIDVLRNASDWAQYGE